MKHILQAAKFSELWPGFALLVIGIGILVVQTFAHH